MITKNQLLNLLNEYNKKKPVYFLLLKEHDFITALKTIVQTIKQSNDQPLSLAQFQKLARLIADFKNVDHETYIINNIYCDLESLVTNASNDYLPILPIQELLDIEKTPLVYYELGRRYELGLGIGVDLQKAQYFYDKALSEESFTTIQSHGENEAHAAFIMGRIYYLGQGSQLQNLEKAQHYFLLASQRGQQDAFYFLGKIAEHNKDYPKAHTFLCKAAEAGSSSAQYDLGRMYYYGNTVDRDRKKALRYFKKAETSGHLDASFFLAKRLEKQHKVLEALNKYQQLADAGHPDACRKIAEYSQTDEFKNQQKALLGYEKVGSNQPQKIAQKGILDVHSELKVQDGPSSLSLVELLELPATPLINDEIDTLYENGQNSQIKNEEQACIFYEKTSQTGHEKAQFSLERLENYQQNRSCLCYLSFDELCARPQLPQINYEIARRYELGIDIQMSKEKSKHYYDRAFMDNGVAKIKADAEQGDTDAQFTWARILVRGQGDVVKDRLLAENFYRMSAEKGHMVAQYYLASLLLSQKNVDEAINWFQKSTRQNYCLASFQLALLLFFKENDPISQKEAFNLFNELQKTGHASHKADIFYYLGYAYYFGIGININNEFAMNNFKKAAQLQHSHAQYYLACMYGRGEGIPNCDLNLAKYWLSQSTHEDAQSTLIKLIHQENDVAQKQMNAAKQKERAQIEVLINEYKVKSSNLGYAQGEYNNSFRQASKAADKYDVCDKHVYSNFFYGNWVKEDTFRQLEQCRVSQISFFNNKCNLLQAKINLNDIAQILHKKISAFNVKFAVNEYTNILVELEEKIPHSSNCYR